MQNGRIYGASDDLVEVEGLIGGDEFPTKNDKVILTLGGKLFIIVKYTGRAVWSIELGQAAEGIHIPLDWTISVMQGVSDYSVQAIIEVPNDVAIMRVDGYDNG